MCGKIIKKKFFLLIVILIIFLIAFLVLRGEKVDYRVISKTWSSLLFEEKFMIINSLDEYNLFVETVRGQAPDYASCFFKDNSIAIIFIYTGSSCNELRMNVRRNGSRVNINYRVVRPRMVVADSVRMDYSCRNK